MWNVQFEDGQVSLQIIGVLLSLGLHVTLQDSEVLWVVPANTLSDVIMIPQSCASLVDTQETNLRIILKRSTEYGRMSISSIDIDMNFI